MYNVKVVNAMLVGQNVKRDGSIRLWSCPATGNYFVARDGAYMLEVREGSEQRHVNLSTFTGEIRYECGRISTYENGKQLSQAVAVA